MPLLSEKKPQLTKHAVEEIIMYVFLYSGPLKADSRGEDLCTFLQPIPILDWMVSLNPSQDPHIDSWNNLELPSADFRPILQTKPHRDPP